MNKQRVKMLKIIIHPCSHVPERVSLVNPNYETLNKE